MCHVTAIEAREVAAKISSAGYGRLIDALRTEGACYTSGGRINCNAVSRVIGEPACDVRRMISDIRSAYRY